MDKKKQENKMKIFRRSIFLLLISVFCSSLVLSFTHNHLDKDSEVYNHTCIVCSFVQIVNNFLFLPKVKLGILLTIFSFLVIPTLLDVKINYTSQINSRAPPKN